MGIKGRMHKKVLIPFYRMSILSEDVKTDVIVENHFICKLPVEEAGLLIAKDKGQRALQVIGESLSPCMRTVYDLLEHLKNGYLATKTNLEEVSLKNERKGGGFAKRFLATELRRVIFGGFLQRPPEPKIPERYKKALLIEIYRAALGKDPLKAKVASSQPILVPFELDFENKEIVSLDKGFLSYQKILSSLWREGVIDPWVFKKTFL